MRVLLLDTAFAAAPIYNSLISAGHEVWVMGNRAHDVLAVKAGSNWIDQDYSQVASVTRHVETLRIERVVPGCTDVSIETCARLGLNSDLVDRPETNFTLANKAAFRRVCADLDLPAPRVVAEGAFPVSGRFICKPVDAFSGRGITLFSGMDEPALKDAVEAARQASPTADMLIETYAVGQLYSCSTFLFKQKLTETFYVREGGGANPYAVDTSYLVRDLPSYCTEMLETGLEKLSSALQLKDGLLHVQFILSDEGPIIVEVMRRCPGDLYSLLIEYSTGFPYAQKYAAGFLGEQVAECRREDRYVLRHTIASPVDALYEGLGFNEPVTVRAFFPVLPVGQPLLSLQRSRAGVLFIEASSYGQLAAEYTRFVSRCAYRTAW